MLTPATLILTVILLLAILVVPRRFVLVSIIAGAVFVPADQGIEISGMSFYVSQLMVIAGVLRLAVRGEIRPLKLNYFDKLFLAWLLVGAVVYIILWGQVSAVIFKCGRLLEGIGLYWVFRQTIRSWDDVKAAIFGLGMCCVVISPFVLLEYVRGDNPFKILGRVITDVREGRYRCQATFPHSIMLGLFWANATALFVGLWRGRSKGNNFLYILAVCASVFIVMASASSTPVVTLIFVAGLLFCYRYRGSGKKAMWWVIGILFVLEIVMSAPVYHLIARVDVVGGSTGWHRYYLIDQAIKFFPEWFLLGTKNTSHWGRGLSDITNHYILEGVRGGLVTMLIFIVMLFMSVRESWKWSVAGSSREIRWLSYGICISMLGHCLSFFGVSYFGQIMILFYFSLAVTGFMAEMRVLSKSKKRTRLVRTKKVKSVTAVQEV